MNKMYHQDIKKLTHLALLIAIEIVLSRFLSISTPIVKIGFGFLPLVLAGMLYGPLAAGMAGAIADFLGAILFPIGAYFPGFTLTAFLVGAGYGLLKRKNINMKHVLMAVALAATFNLVLNTLWIVVLYGKTATAILPARIMQWVILAPIQFVGISLLARVRGLVTTAK